MVDFKHIADPRRLELAAFAIGGVRQNLMDAINFDNELWAIGKNTKEPMIARIRIQFYADELERIKSGQAPSAPIGEFFQACKAFSQLEDLIWAHIENIENPNIESSKKIWECYFNLGQKIAAGAYNIEISKLSALIFDGANRGDFTLYQTNAKQLQNTIKAQAGHFQKLILPIIGVISLCKKPQLFEDIIAHDDQKRLGIFAKIALFKTIALQAL